MPISAWWFDVLQANTGSMQRIKYQMQRLQNATSVTLGFYGGSITAGSGAGPHMGYVYRLQAWLGAAFPGVRVITERELDMSSNLQELNFLVIDQAVNSDDPTNMEQLLRAALSAPSRIACVAFHWLRHNATEHRYAGPPLGTANTWYDRANFEAALSPTLQYYGIPAISFKSGLHPLAIATRQAARDLWAPDLAHPNQAGHDMIASALAQLLQRGDDTCRPQDYPKGTALPEGLPRKLPQALPSALNPGGDATNIWRWFNSTALFGSAIVNSGWGLTSGERSSLGQPRPTALLSSTSGAVLVIPASLPSRAELASQELTSHPNPILILITFMRSYERFGLASICLDCASHGCINLDGRQADRTSLFSVARMKVSHDSLPNDKVHACNLTLTNLGSLDNRSHFKVKHISLILASREVAWRPVGIARSKMTGDPRLQISA
jgi:hypothetical protein